jgi:hypothetical protein
MRLREWKPISGSGPVPFEAERWAEPLERETTILKDLGAQVHLSQREIVLLRANRRRALKAYDDDFVEYASVIAGYFQVGGYGRQARSIRPSKKYRGRTQAEIRQLGKAPRRPGSADRGGLAGLGVTPQGLRRARLAHVERKNRFRVRRVTA